MKSTTLLGCIPVAGSGWSRLMSRLLRPYGPDASKALFWVHTMDFHDPNSLIAPFVHIPESQTDGWAGSQADIHCMMACMYVFINNGQSSPQQNVRTDSSDRTNV